MTTKRVIEHIAYIMTAIKNCRERAEQPLGGDAERWANRHNGALGDLLRDTLPQGSGFDSGVSLDYELTDVEKERYVFECPFHAMNETGYYVGWYLFRVTVTPSFIGGINLEIETIETCDDPETEYQLDEYVAETMNDALTTEYEIPRSYYAEQ